MQKRQQQDALFLGGGGVKLGKFSSGLLGNLVDSFLGFFFNNDNPKNKITCAGAHLGGDVIFIMPVALAL